jgi:hypothetical protein
LYAIKEHASDKDLAEIESALEPPITSKTGGVPTWYGSDEDAWEQFTVQV